MRRLRVTALIIAATLAVLNGGTARAVDWKTLDLKSGKMLRYALVLPKAFDSEKTYPVLLAFPGGSQDERTVDGGFRYWGEQAATRGWIVVSPAASSGVLFFRGGEILIPALLAEIRHEFKVEHGRFHVAGISNGGLSAFRVATLYPEDFLSITTLPGAPPSKADWDRLPVVANMPVRMFGGSEDESWVRSMQKAERELRRLGADVQLEVFEGEGHVPRSLRGYAVMVSIDESRRLISDE